MKKLEERERLIESVFDKFLEADDRQAQWTNLDTNMANLEFLDDNQLLKETEMAYVKMSMGIPMCRTSHTDSECFVPQILLSVLYIMDDYDRRPILNTERQYILRYFLSLYAIGEIYIS